MRPVLIALQFLTCIPVRLRRGPTAAEYGYSLLAYPLVGLLLGALLWTIARGLWFLPASLTAALCLGLWVIATGGLHLDGLADTADAWVGGRGDREKTLAIMKDPRSGPMGVTAVVVLLLVKYGALQMLVDSRQREVVMLAPLLARTVIPAMFLVTPYVREQGLGSDLARHLPRRAALAAVLLVAAACVMVFRMEGAVAVLATVLLSALWRARMRARLGGFTGDAAGALIEAVEAIVLVAAALAMSIAALAPQAA